MRNPQSVLKEEDFHENLYAFKIFNLNYISVGKGTGSNERKNLCLGM